MRNSEHGPMSIELFLFALTLFLISCAPSENGKKTAVPSPPNSNASPANTISPASQAAEPLNGFSVNKVCSLPAEVSGDSPFGALGGGKWDKWDDSESGLNYGCIGGNDSVKLEQETAKISARYDAMGDAKAAHYVSAKYIALQYGGRPPVENGLRRGYIDFCDNLSKSFYGQPLPEKFRKRLMDESTYSNSETPNNYHESVGGGYVNLAARREGELMVALEVRFFSSEAEYKKYKDS